MSWLDELRLQALVSTVVYSVLGIIMLVLTIVVVNKLFNLNMREELVEDNNVAFGVMIAGIAVAIAIIIAGTIAS